MQTLDSTKGFVIAFSVLLLTGVTYAQKSQTGDGTGQVPGHQMNKSNSLFEKQAMDMTGDQTGLAGKYDVVPVRRGELVDENAKHLDQLVKNNKGERIGTITKLLKDTKTGTVEYAVLELEDDKFQMPIQWSQFKRKGDHLTLNATQKELRPITNSTSGKDKSPDVSEYMDEINSVRSQPKPKVSSPSTGGSNKPPIAGPMGETETAGDTTPSHLPDRAPGHEGDHPSSKR